MSVKRSQSASRVLHVLEGIARHQPVGVSELARHMGEDKSAVQRAIMTLADDGWIHTAPGEQTRWQLTAHILTVAHTAHNRDDLRLRSRSTLEALRRDTGETVLLTVPGVSSFVVIDVVESQQMLRTVPHTGMVVPPLGSATSRAILPYMSAAQQADLLGGAPNDELLAIFATTLERGYAVSDGDVLPGSTNIAAPIVEVDGRPVAAIVVSGPSDRLTPDHHERIGNMVCRAAQGLSSRAAPHQPGRPVQRERPEISTWRTADA